MKKRTYKQIQNRLYREIKRRIIVEKQLLRSTKLAVERSRIETLCIRNAAFRHTYYCNEAKYVEFLKRNMARSIADKLLDDGYIVFYTSEQNDGPYSDYVEIEARLKVARYCNDG